MATGQQIHRFEGPVDIVLDVAFGPNEKTVLSVSGDGSVTHWDIETGEILRRFLGHDSWVWSLDLSHDGRRLVSGDEEGTIILWDFETGEELRRFKGHTGLVPALEFGPAGETVYSAAMEGSVIEWKMSDTSLEELIKWIDENRFVRDFNCEERDKYHIVPLCEATNVD